MNCLSIDCTSVLILHFRSCRLWVLTNSWTQPMRLLLRILNCLSTKPLPLCWTTNWYSRLTDGLELRRLNSNHREKDANSLSTRLTLSVHHLFFHKQITVLRELSQCVREFGPPSTMLRNILNKELRLRKWSCLQLQFRDDFDSYW